MKVGQQSNIGNVVPFRPRSGDDGDLVDDLRRDNIIRLLDLSKYEQSRPAVGDYEASMRANIAAMVLLGLLVFIAKEDFGKLARPICAWLNRNAFIKRHPSLIYNVAKDQNLCGLCAQDGLNH